MAICHHDTIESSAPTRILFQKLITRRRLIRLETQTHLTIDPGGNFRHFSQRFSGSLISGTTFEIDLEWLRHELRGH